MKKAYNPYRLQRDVLPLVYTIELEPDLEKFTFKGRESVTLRASKPFSKITLHAVDLKILKAALVLKGGQRLPAKKISYDAKFETAALSFGRTVKPAESPRLEIEFTGVLNDKMHGFYRTSYQAGGQKRWGAATQFEATDARRAFPCWDEPDMKAKFLIRLRVPKRLTALSNMPVEKEKSIPKGLKEVSYKVTPVMSTYLVCFVIADLEYLEAKDKNGVLVRVYTTPGKKAQGKFALDVALHTLPYFHEWFGIRYCLPKCDMVALPDFASGAMENWGLITYRETALLVDPKNSSVAARQRVAEVIDHELAHQWFGNLVTMEWWTDLWLNEGFASYMGPKAVDHQFPEWRIWNQYVATEYIGALREDSLKNTHPIEIPVKNPAEIREIFDAITYGKGSSVNRMLEHYLGEPAVRRGLKKYLKRFEYGNAKTQDLWKALEEVSGKPVRAMMASFTKQGGHPVIGVRTRDAASGEVLEMTQKRFIFDGSPDPENLRWNVPVTARFGAEGETQAYFLRTPKAFEPLPGGLQDWIKINPEQSGFYRVAYSPELLKPLRDAIRKGFLGPIDCLGVLDDTFVLARAGEVRTSLALDLASECVNQTDYNVWTTVASILGSVENVLDGTGSEEDLKYIGGELFRTIAGRLGWEARASDTHLDVLLRALVLSRRGHYGNDETVAEARSRFSDYVKGGTLDPNLRGAVYGLTAETGGMKEYDQLFSLYKKSALQEEKVRILRALTRFKDPAVAQKALKFAISGDVRAQDRYVVLGGFGSNPAVRRLAWNFIKKEWKTLARYFSGGNVGLLSRILEGASSGFTAESDYEDVKKFFKSHPIPGAERAMKQSLEVIAANIRWIRRDVDDIRSWLGGRRSFRPMILSAA